MWNKQTVVCLWCNASVAFFYIGRIWFFVGKCTGIDKDTKAINYPSKSLNCPTLPTFAQIWDREHKLYVLSEIRDSEPNFRHYGFFFLNHHLWLCRLLDPPLSHVWRCTKCSRKICLPSKIFGKVKKCPKNGQLR